MSMSYTFYWFGKLCSSFVSTRFFFSLAFGESLSTFLHNTTSTRHALDSLLASTTNLE